MPNANYIKGIRFEREIVNKERKEGNIAFRSAGSHSPVDVVVIDKDFKQIWFIQAKTGQKKHTKLEKEFNDVSSGWTVYFKVMEK